MLINLTPHALCLITNDGETVLESRGIARVSTVPGEVINKINGVPVKSRDTLGAVEGLPEPQANVYYIVSAIVGAACHGRSDVLVPGTGPNDNPRRENGRVTGIRCLKHV